LTSPRPHSAAEIVGELADGAEKSVSPKNDRHRPPVASSVARRRLLWALAVAAALIEWGAMCLVGLLAGRVTAALDQVLAIVFAVHMCIHIGAGFVASYVLRAGVGRATLAFLVAGLLVAGAACRGGSESGRWMTVDLLGGCAEAHSTGPSDHLDEKDFATLDSIGDAIGLVLGAIAGAAVLVSTLVAALFGVAIGWLLRRGSGAATDRPAPS
jgi:hypothetical protein